MNFKDTPEFKLRKKVWVINKEDPSCYEKCSICDGHTWVLIKTNYFTCPNCEGNGEVQVAEVPRRSVLEGEIRTISFCCDVDDVEQERYSVYVKETDDYFYDLELEEIFITKEEAKRKIQEGNS